MDRTPRVDRRTALRRTACASAASIFALAGCVSLEVPTEPASGSNVHGEFTLGAKTSGWHGVAPEEITEERNPELRMLPGKSVELTLENLDGEPHKLVIEDSGGNTLVESPELAERGESRTVTFEADQEMTSYLCEYHSVKMRGDMLVTTY